MLPYFSRNRRRYQCIQKASKENYNTVCKTTGGAFLFYPILLLSVIHVPVLCYYYLRSLFCPVLKKVTVNSVMPQRDICMGAHLPVFGLWGSRWINHGVWEWDAWPVRRQTYGYLPSLCWCQIYELVFNLAVAHATAMLSRLPCPVFQRDYSRLGRTEKLWRLLVQAGALVAVR